ncbi:hypothetical protein [Chitinophaga silvisoli]|uniref:DUF2938 family protein n=1 Tax=Chitinophaga silvisoli TaxID=2291814 RepID=A0A3E1NTR3_9BACT|nr:hypothetical protein [Chitinophaga silvisoli]RFM31303.1 hypothetical protein DXN04_29705 [Chitinophaga silvisoli]
MQNYLIIIIAGIAGTLLMTGAVYLLSALTGKNYKVVGILATMLANHTTKEKGLTRSTPDILLGIAVHYLIGIFFAFIYYFLWQMGYLALTINSSILFGLSTGIVAIIFWSLFIRFHPNPPLIPVFTYVLSIGLVHILFSLGTYLVFSLMY